MTVIYRSRDELAEAHEIQRSQTIIPHSESRIDMVIRRETEAGVYTAEELRELAQLLPASCEVGGASYLAALRLR